MLRLAEPIHAGSNLERRYILFPFSHCKRCSPIPPLLFPNSYASLHLSKVPVLLSCKLHLSLSACFIGTDSLGEPLSYTSLRDIIIHSEMLGNTKTLGRDYAKSSHVYAGLVLGERHV
jgi:hypothetical protein